MAKAELRSRTSKAAKSSGKAPAARKRKPASSKSGKAFMLKESKSDPTALVAVPKQRKRPASRRPTSKAKAITAPTVVPVSEAAPAQPPQALVVWKKHGAMDSLSYWLRSTGRDLLRRVRSGRAVVPATGAPISAKLRTKNDLLREIAALRQENATLRDRLGLPQMPFGRQVADIF